MKPQLEVKSDCVRSLLKALIHQRGCEVETTERFRLADLVSVRASAGDEQFDIQCNIVSVRRDGFDKPVAVKVRASDVSRPDLMRKLREIEDAAIVS